MTSAIKVLAWDKHKNVVALKWLMGSQSSPLDNLISNGITYINKRYKPPQIRLHSKRPHTITKMNDNINMDSTISGSTNARSELTIS